ncbi:MAG: hydrolase [Bacteroidota bacterium]
MVKSKGQNVKKMYMWYTTCPKCAKKYGRNYVAIVSQIE